MRLSSKVRVWWYLIQVRVPCLHGQLMTRNGLNIIISTTKIKSKSSLVKAYTLPWDQVYTSINYHHNNHQHCQPLYWSNKTTYYQQFVTNLISGTILVMAHISFSNWSQSLLLGWERTVCRSICGTWWRGMMW